MAARRNVPPIADAGLPGAIPAGKIDATIGRVAGCMLKYQAMISADIDQAMALVRANVLVNQTAIDAWTVSELDKVRSIYGRCAECLKDWLDRQQWESLQLAAALVPPAGVTAGSMPGPVLTINPPPIGTINCTPEPAGIGAGNYFMAGAAWTVFTTPGQNAPSLGPIAGAIFRAFGFPHATAAAANAVAAGLPKGAAVPAGFAWGNTTPGGYTAVGYVCMALSGSPPPPVCPPLTCPTGQHWDAVACACVNDATCQPTSACPKGYHWDTVLCQCVVDVAAPPPGECCLPGQRVTIYSDNTWTVEGDLKDFPDIAALLPGVLKIIKRDDPVTEEAEWELDDGPPPGTLDLKALTYEDADSPTEVA